VAFDGGCLCGAVRYRIDRKFLNAINCYCSMCQRAHGGAYSTHVIVKPEQLEWLHGRSEMRTFESSTEAYREFCSHCGAQLLVHGQSGDGTLGIPAGTLDNGPALTLLGHMFVIDRVQWCAITDHLPQYADWPPGFEQSNQTPDYGEIHQKEHSG
jgi:hypothetical protein